MCGITSQINPIYEFLDHLFSNATYVISNNFKTTTYYSSIVCMKADVYLYHVTVTLDTNEMIAT